MDYCSLFPGVSLDRPRFMALAAAVLRQAEDLQAVTGEINRAFSPEHAQGLQLDALGASLGLSRPALPAGGAAPDETFREYIRKKLLLWTWDGTNGSVPAVLAETAPGAVQEDGMDGTVTVAGAGEQPAPVKELFPVAAGIRVIINEEGVDTV